MRWRSFEITHNSLHCKELFPTNCFLQSLVSFWKCEIKSDPWLLDSASHISSLWCWHDFYGLKISGVFTKRNVMQVWLKIQITETSPDSENKRTSTEQRSPVSVSDCFRFSFCSTAKKIFWQCKILGGKFLPAPLSQHVTRAIWG